MSFTTAPVLFLSHVVTHGSIELYTQHYSVTDRIAAQRLEFDAGDFHSRPESGQNSSAVFAFTPSSATWLHSILSTRLLLCHFLSSPQLSTLSTVGEPPTPSPPPRGTFMIHTVTDIISAVVPTKVIQLALQTIPLRLACTACDCGKKVLAECRTTPGSDYKITPTV